MSATISTLDISNVFAGIPAKLLARITGRPPATIIDCRSGRSRWRAEDLILAAQRDDEVRARVLKLLEKAEAP